MKKGAASKVKAVKNLASISRWDPGRKYSTYSSVVTWNSHLVKTRVGGHSGMRNSNNVNSMTNSEVTSHCARLLTLPAQGMVRARGTS